jgi:hypothetical protein
MDGLELGLKALNLIVSLSPSEKHPPADYSELSKPVFADLQTLTSSDSVISLSDFSQTF